MSFPYISFVLVFLKNLFNNNPDLICKKINSNYFIIYFESLCAPDKINEYITKPILLSGYITAPHTLDLNFNEVVNYLTNGFVIVIYKNNKLYAT